jgi:hypothetical protein
MAFNKVSVADRFVPAKYDDYGTRKGPVKALVYHMAEGWNVWRYLSTGNIARGVSVHFTVEDDGEIVQMLNLSRISGSINPNTLRTTTDENDYYGYKHAKGVLGSWWSNPNNAVLSVEVAGKAADGPNDKQVAAMIRLFEYIRRQYPDIAPLGHRDFQSVKRCPGSTGTMKAAFKGMGGHGLDYKKPPEAQTPAGGVNTGKDDKDNEMIVSTGGIVTTSNSTVSLKDGTKVYYAPGGEVAYSVNGDGKRLIYGYGRHNNSDWMAVGFNTRQSFSDGIARPTIGWVKGRLTVEKRVDDPAPPDSARVEELEALLEEAAQAVLSAGVAADNASELIRKAEAALDG